MIDISTGEVLVQTATWKDIIFDRHGKIWMHYVVYDPEPDVGDGI